MDNDFAQLSAWRKYRETNSTARLTWRLIVCYQPQKNRLHRAEVSVQAQTAEDAKRIALGRYQKMYPRRKQAWVESAEKV